MLSETCENLTEIVFRETFWGIRWASWLKLTNFHLAYLEKLIVRIECSLIALDSKRVDYHTSNARSTVQLGQLLGTLTGNTALIILSNDTISVASIM